MKSKFITGILTLAVVLGLLLVPAVGVFAQPPAGKATFQLPANVYVVEDQAFAVNVTIWNPNSMVMTAAGTDLQISDPSKLTISAIDGGDWPTWFTPGWDNTTGESWTNAAGSLASPNITTDALQCVIHFVAGSSSGVVTVNFVPSGDEGETLIFDPASDDICDWGSIQNMTVTIGTPELCVDVSPAGTGDVKIGGASPPATYPNCTDHSWSAVVTLEAVDPAPGWHFNEWIGDVDNTTDNPTTITISALENNVTAVFCELPCELDVYPDTVPQLKARYAATGGNEDSDTVTVKNAGGGTLRWQVGYPPIWSLGDTWTYMNTYDSVPNASSGGFDPYPNPYWQSWVPCLENNTPLVLAVVAEDNCTYTAVADWPYADPQRTDSTLSAPLCMHDAVVTVDKCNLDYIQQVANLTLHMSPTQSMPVTAIVNWAYDGCHGWPYYMGKSWSYNMTIIMPAPVGTKTVPAHAMVTAVNQVDPQTGTTFSDCAIITHYLTNPMVDTFMMQWWSDTARNIVFQWDGGTFKAPPVDVRALIDMSITGAPAPACCDAPSWLSFDKLSCNLGADETAVITVTANTTGLASNSYHNGSFCISSCCCTGVHYECVNVSLWVQPATTLTDLVRVLPPDALLADAEYPGDSFYVYVNFTSLGDDFNSIGVTDYAPPGWLVETNNTWCEPASSYNKSNYNKAEYAWAGPFNASATFSAKYKVTIPATASPGSNFWPECSAMPCPPCGGSPIMNYPAWVDYWIGPDGPFETMICEDREKIVTVPGCETGETRDVLGNVLDTVTVNLYEDDDVWEDQDTSSIVGGIAVYEDCADDTGMYYKIASKYCYFSVNTRPVGDGGSMPASRNPAYPDYIDWSTPEKLAAGNVLDFVGDYGLVCRAASLSMAMEAVNHMLFTPEEPIGTQHPDWKLSSWKVTQVVNSWQFPAGCGCS